MLRSTSTPALPPLRAPRLLDPVRERVRYLHYSIRTEQAYVHCSLRVHRIIRRMIRLAVGLGNPGPEYEDTRHNAGFWWLDEVARKLGAKLAFDRNYHGRVARVNRPEGPLWLLAPLTYMNLSGKSVGALARFFKIEPQEILVAHDELDIAPGALKLKFAGGAAGHNGLKDIHAQLGSPDYWRLRIGIGHPGNKDEVVDYVLRKPRAEERRDIDDAIARSLASLDLLLGAQMTQAATQLHGKAAVPKPPKPPRPARATSVKPEATPDDFRVDSNAPPPPPEASSE